MAHFVELDQSGIVVRSIVVGDNSCLDAMGNESEAVGVAFCRSLYGVDTVWKQTSYNTHGGSHKNGGIPFRKNYAGIGYKYDQSRDAFIPPQPYASWSLNEDTCLWEPPVPYPSDNTTLYTWNEDQQNWVAVTDEVP